MTRFIKCPICNNQAKREYYTGPFGIEEEYKKRAEEEYIPKWEAELETLTKSYNKMKAEAGERKEEWDSFAN